MNKKEKTKFDYKYILKLLFVFILIVLACYGALFVKKYYLPSHYSSIYSLQLSPDGKELAAYDDIGKKIYFIDWAENKIVKTLPIKAIYDMKLSPYGKYLAIIKYQQIQLVDFKKKKILYITKGSNAAFTPDGKKLIFVREDSKDKKTVFFYDIEKGDITNSLSYEMAADDKLYVATAKGSDGLDYMALKDQNKEYIEFFELQTLKKVGRVETKEVKMTRFFSTRNQIILSDYDSRTFIIDPANLISKQKILNFDVNMVSFNGKLGVGEEYINKKAYLVLYDMETGKSLWQTPIVRRFIRSLAFSGDNRYLATGSLNSPRIVGNVVIYDIKTGKILRTFKPSKLEDKK